MKYPINPFNHWQQNNYRIYKLGTRTAKVAILRLWKLHRTESFMLMLLSD